MKRSLIFSFVIIITLISVSSCAPVGRTSDEYGFFSGLVHGFVWPFALIGKLFGADIGLYATNNTGFFYWLGFIMGLGALGGGGSQARR